MNLFYFLIVQVKLKQFIGNISYRGAEMKASGVEPNPGPGDIRRLITEYCILPLGEDPLKHWSNFYLYRF